MRAPLHHWDAPADIASLHPEIGQWRREGAWRRATERDSFEAIFANIDHAERRCAVVHRAVMQREEAILWSIENGKPLASSVRKRSHDRNPH